MREFSVLMSVYEKDDPNYFIKSLESIFDQTLAPTEVILVKDGPLPDQVNYVIDNFKKKYQSLKVVPLPHNVGLGKALNEGLKVCSHDIVARMDSDDICKPDRFEKQLAILNYNQQIDVVSSWIDEFEGDIEYVTNIKKIPEFHEEISKYTRTRNPINHPAVMFRKSAVTAAGNYQDFYLFEDYYLWIRMLKNGAKFYNIQESLLYFRSSPLVYKRRGGWRYALSEYRFQLVLKSFGYQSTVRFIMTTPVRFLIRISPVPIRRLIYKKLLR